jgi:hypothetical protein
MTEINTTHSSTLGALAKALAAAQAELEDAKKDSVNPHFKNKYASLGSVRAELKRVLPRFGLATLQTTKPHGDAGVCVVTWLVHESGEWICGELYLPVGKKDAQGFGSALTYARRYGLTTITGIAADEDDDGEHATKNGAPKPEPAKTKPESDAKEKELGDALDKAKTTEDIAKVEGDAAKAVKAGVLTDAARGRLLKKRADAIGRLTAPAVAS